MEEYLRVIFSLVLEYYKEMRRIENLFKTLQNLPKFSFNTDFEFLQIGYFSSKVEKLASM
jgi:hypothetical protein